MTTSEMQRPLEGERTSLKDRCLEAAKQAQKNSERERVDPEFRAQRERERAEALAAAKLAHEAQQRDELRAFLLSCGVGRREADIIHRGVDADAARYPLIARCAEFWKATDKHILAIYGGTGTGKTLAACTLIAECRFDFHHPDFGPSWAWPSGTSQRGHYALAGDLATTSSFGERAEKAMRHLTQYRVLVIDELGQELMTAPWLSMLERIVGERHRQKRKTVLLGNCDMVTFKTQYGEKLSEPDAQGRRKTLVEGRIMRRIRDDGIAIDAGTRQRNPGSGK